MSNHLPPIAQPAETHDPPAKGPNLILIYGLILLGFVIAFGVAALIVLPFYHRR